MKNNDRECIILKSYDVIGVEPEQEVLRLTRSFRDEFLVDSSNSWLIERYYNVSRKCQSTLNQKFAHHLLEEHIPFIVQGIKDQNHKRVIDLTISMLDYFEAFSCEQLSA